MFECCIQLGLPLAFASEPDITPIYLSVSKFNFDPGLNIGDQFCLEGMRFGWNGDAALSADVMVVNRKKIVRPKEKKSEPDIFRLDILVEVADKEKLPRICEILKEFNPGKLIDPPLVSDT